MTPAEERSGDLLDVALADEIELVSDLVVAASSSPRHFTPQEVDELLGVPGAAGGSTADSTGGSTADSTGGSTGGSTADSTGDVTSAPPETPTADGTSGTGVTRPDAAGSSDSSD
jgi:hypothetical protein